MKLALPGSDVQATHGMPSQPREGILSPWDINFKDDRLYCLPLQEQRGHGTSKRVKQHLQAENDGSEMILILKRSSQQLPFAFRVHAGTEYLKLPKILGIC